MVVRAFYCTGGRWIELTSERAALSGHNPNMPAGLAELARDHLALRSTNPPSRPVSMTLLTLPAPADFSESQRIIASLRNRHSAFRPTGVIRSFVTITSTIPMDPHRMFEPVVP